MFETTQNIFRFTLWENRRFRRLQSRYKNYQQVNTDGSKQDSTVCCAVISGNHCNMQHLPDDSSISTA